MLRFCKYHGLGNDFVLIDDRDGQLALGPAQAQRLCDRRRGVGADGVLLARVPTLAAASYRMDIFNADGSRAEMCGNGLRCFVRHAVERLGAPHAELAIETMAGVHRCVAATPPDDRITVSMGRARFGSSDLPTPLDATQPTPVALPLPGGSTAWGYPVDMGNPHIVLFGSYTRANASLLGPHIQALPLFPRGVNVGFAQAPSAEHVELLVYERGAGLTEACGTGACAAAIVARRLGRVGTKAPTRVSLPGGDLWISEDANGLVWMAGPAVHVFDGELSSLP